MTLRPSGHVLVCGDVINDIVVKPLESLRHDTDTRAVIRHCSGGSAANQAAWLGRLGTPVALVGRVGAEDADWHRDQLGSVGVDTHLVIDTDVPTGSIVVLLDQHGDRTMLVDRGAGLRLRESDVPAQLFDEARALHLTGYSFVEQEVREVALGLIARARRRGLPYSIDPSSAGFLSELPPGAFRAWTAGAAVCFPNADEARVLTGADVPAQAATELLADYETVVVTCGSAGAVVAERSGSIVAIPAPPVDVVDSTGAGDAFCAAYLAAAHAGATPTDATRRAVEVSSQVVQRFGARPLAAL